MIKKLKILTVLGTRPEIIRMSVILNKFDKYFDSFIVNTMQNDDSNLNINIFKDLNIKGKITKFELGNNLTHIGKTIKIMSLIEKQIMNISPDIFFVLGDTNSSLASIIAKKMKIPVFHMEAGNRCFDSRVPEEINRKLVDHLADINLTYSDISRNYLIRENFPIDRIIKVGSPLKEVFSFYQKKINNSKIVNKLKLKKNSFFLCSFHRSENIDNNNNLFKIFNLLNEIAKIYKLNIIVTTHPRTRHIIDQTNYDTFDKRIRFIDPIIYTDFIKLQMNAKVVLSDSGSITEESSIIGFNAINIRENHERPEGMEEGTVIMSNLNSNTALIAIEKLINTKIANKIVKDYDVNNVSEKICNIVLSYKDFVNRVVWHK